MNNVLLDNSAHDKIDSEEPTLFHVLKMNKRRAQWNIQQVWDHLGNVLNSPTDINTLTRHLREKYKTTAVGNSCVPAMMDTIWPPNPTMDAASLEDQ